VRGAVYMPFAGPGGALLRAGISGVGLARATVVAPAIERLRHWQTWLQCADEMPINLLQVKVSEALDALPRGREPLPPGEHFRRAVLSGLPDIEAMELVERFFELGKRVVGSPNPVAIFLAGCRECLPEWELQAANPLRRVAIERNPSVCPRGRTRETDTS